MMHKPALKTLLLAAGLLGVLSHGTTASATVAAVVTQYDFTFSTSPDSGYGVLNTTNNGDGTLNAISGNIHVSGPDGPGTYFLYTGPLNPWPTSSDISWDTTIYPNGDPGAGGPVLDNTGLLFTNGDAFFSIWGDVPPPDPQYGFQYDLLGDGGDNIPDSFFTLTAVPEPATLALLGGSLLGFGVFRRRRKS